MKIDGVSISCTENDEHICSENILGQFYSVEAIWIKKDPQTFLWQWYLWYATLICMFASMLKWQTSLLVDTSNIIRPNQAAYTIQ